jgi:hypothetical protein
VMAKIVYFLCALLSAGCMMLLIRSFLRTRARLLLWSSIGFAGLAANNTLVVFDLVIFPQVDLAPWRLIAMLVGVTCFLAGLIWDAV